MSAIRSRERWVSTAPGYRTASHCYTTRMANRAVSSRDPEIAVPSREDPLAGSGTDATYSRVAELPLEIERCELLPLTRDTSSGFTKISIVVRLTGAGHEGLGEDITWDQIDQIEQL